MVNDVLVREWFPSDDKQEWNTVMQIVVLQPYQQDLLSVAHDGPFSAHLGIRKTYDRVLRHLFWPGL